MSGQPRPHKQTFPNKMKSDEYGQYQYHTVRASILVLLSPPPYIPVQDIDISNHRLSRTRSQNDTSSCEFNTIIHSWHNKTLKQQQDISQQQKNQTSKNTIKKNKDSPILCPPLPLLPALAIMTVRLILVVLPPRLALGRLAEAMGVWVLE